MHLHLLPRPFISSAHPSYLTLDHLLPSPLSRCWCASISPRCVVARSYSRAPLLRADLALGSFSPPDTTFGPPPSSPFPSIHPSSLSSRTNGATVLPLVLSVLGSLSFCSAFWLFFRHPSVFSAAQQRRLGSSFVCDVFFTYHILRQRFKPAPEAFGLGFAFQIIVFGIRDDWVC